MLDSASSLRPSCPSREFMTCSVQSSDVAHRAKQKASSTVDLPCQGCSPCSGSHSMFQPCFAFSCSVPSPSSLPTMIREREKDSQWSAQHECGECWIEPYPSTTMTETMATMGTDRTCAEKDACSAAMMTICCAEPDQRIGTCLSPTAHHGIVLCADDECVGGDEMCQEVQCDDCQGARLAGTAVGQVYPCDVMTLPMNGCTSTCDGILLPGPPPWTATKDFSGGGERPEQEGSVLDQRSIGLPESKKQQQQQTFTSFEELMQCCCCSDVVLDQCCQFVDHNGHVCTDGGLGELNGKGRSAELLTSHRHHHHHQIGSHSHDLPGSAIPSPLQSSSRSEEHGSGAIKAQSTFSTPGSQSNDGQSIFGTSTLQSPSDASFTTVDMESVFASLCGCPPTDELGHAHEHPCRWEGCHQTFTTHAALTDHIAHEHVGSGKARYECRWIGCKREDRTFMQRQKVLRHLQTHTGDRPFVCSTCGKRFSEANTLAQHKRIHTREKPYVCDHPGCGKAFGVAGSLTIHKRTHTGEKPFKCTWPGCHRAFSESSNLTKHARIHTGERPFACTAHGCSKSFSRPDQLARHAKTHAKVQRHMD